MTPEEVPETLSGLTKASKRHQKKHPKRHQRNQKSKSKIDVNVIATATPPTQRSNKTTSKMISAQRNARSAPPPHRGRRARPNSRVPCLRLGSLPRFSAEIGSRTPPLSSPGPLRIPPGRSQKISLGTFLASKIASKISLEF